MQEQDDSKAAASLNPPPRPAWVMSFESWSLGAYCRSLRQVSRSQSLSGSSAAICLSLSPYCVHNLEEGGAFAPGHFQGLPETCESLIS